MRGRVWVIAVGLLALAAGCQNVDEPPAPEFATGSTPGQYMSLARPAGDLTALADQTTVTAVAKRKIEYGPLHKPGVKGDDTESEKTEKVAAAKPAKKSAPKGEAKKSVARSGKRSRIGSTLSGLVNLVPGRKKAAPPPAARAADDSEDDEGSADEKPAKPKTPAKAAKAKRLKLVDPRGPIVDSDIPAPPQPLTEPQLKSLRAAAEAAAIRNLMRQVFAAPLDPTTTVGEAVGQSPDDFPGKPEGLNVVAARWLDDGSLELTVQISVPQLVQALGQAYEDVSFDPLLAGADQKAAEGKGSANLGALEEGETKPKKRGPAKSGGAAVS